MPHDDVVTKKKSAAKKKKARAAKVKAAAAAEAASIDQDALLAAWLKTRSPRIADVLQCVPVDGVWTSRLAAIAKGSTSWATRDRIKRLPEDPRVTVFLIECLRKARWPGSSATTIWTLIFKRLVSLADARAIPPLRAAAATPPYFLGAAHTEWIVSQISATADALEKIAAKQKDDDKNTIALVETQAHAVTPPPEGWFPSPKPTAEALLQQVWAAPDDDGARAVAADALLEQNDAWGELITLQLQTSSNGKKKEQRKGKGKTAHEEQEAKLIRKHASRIAGPIAKVAPIAKLVFERGFLAEVLIGKGGMIGRRLWEDALRAPHWATVHTVRFDHWDQPPRWWLTTFFTAAPLVSLRAVKVGTVLLERSSRDAAWRFTSAPQRVDDRITSACAALVKGMPVSERSRIPTPKSPSMREWLEGRESEDWDPR